MKKGRWVWIKMPEKKYFGYASMAGKVSSIAMVDPIPNRPQDECYGEARRSKNIADAVRSFEKGMLEDRKRYFGSVKWRPSRRELSRLWKGRSERLQMIHDGLKDD